MASVLDIVRGISQAAANAYDGSQDEKYSLDGEARKIGLKREEGDPIIDSRVVDGFNVRMSGPILTISYQSDIKLKDVYAGDIEADVDEMIENVASFLKKEYKKVTGDSLSLTADGEVDVLVQNTSKVRVFVTGKKNYKIGNLEGVLEVGLPSEDRLDKSIRDFISLGKQ
tara:strand:- start:30 stop:539 length:510 start_codon:yes stop_codon:yes gene_type:complete